MIYESFEVLVIMSQCPSIKRLCNLFRFVVIHTNGFNNIMICGLQINETEFAISCTSVGWLIELCVLMYGTLDRAAI